MMKLIEFLITHAAAIGTVLGAALTAASALVSGVSSRRTKPRLTSHRSDGTEDGHLHRRLNQATEALLRQQLIERHNHWANMLLVFGQYVIGGVLAAAFVQESLSREIVGLLGVLVLISSLINQRYRPALKIRGAMSRCVKLRALIRSVEDDIVLIKKEGEVRTSKQKLIEKLSLGLDEIEASELREFEDLTREEKELGIRQSA